MAVFVRTGLSLLGMLGLLFFASCGGGGGPAPTPTPVTPRPLTGAGADATRSSDAPASPTPTRPATLVATQTVALPTPVLPGFPTIPLPSASPDREIIDTVNRNGPAYSAALTRLDTSPLSTVFTGQALADFTQEIEKDRAQNIHSQNALVEISLVSLDRAETTANVKTRERWRYQVGNTCTVYTYDEFYQLTPVQGRWMISQDQDTQIGSTGC